MTPIRTLILSLATLGVWAAAQVRGPAFEAAPGSPFAVGAGPGDVALGDLDGDSRLDVVTANGKSSDVSLLLGDGRGGLRPAPGSPLRTAIPMHLVVIADMNRDKKPDLVLSGHDSDAVTVLLGDGRASFTPAAGSPFRALAASKPHNHGLAVGDVNRDGRPDIVAGDQDANAVGVLLQTASGGYQPAAGSPVAVGRGPYPIALADMNGDGSLDVVAPNTASHDIGVLLGDGKGGFRPAPGSPVSVTKRPYFVTAADINADRALDLAAAHDDTDLMTLLVNDARARFRPSTVKLGRRAGAIAAADLDGDGRVDLAAATGDSVSILRGDGRGAFAHTPGSPFSTGDGSWKVAIGDLNGDRRPDIVTNNVTGSTVTVLLAR